MLVYWRFDPGTSTTLSKLIPKCVFSLLELIYLIFFFIHVLSAAVSNSASPPLGHDPKCICSHMVMLGKTMLDENYKMQVAA